MPPHPAQVLKYNGTHVRNLRHLAELVTTCSQPFMRFDLDNAGLVVVERAEAIAAAQEIRSSHGVPHLMSADLRKAGLVWPPSTRASNNMAQANSSSD